MLGLSIKGGTSPQWALARSAMVLSGLPSTSVPGPLTHLLPSPVSPGGSMVSIVPVDMDALSDMRHLDTRCGGAEDTDISM